MGPHVCPWRESSPLSLGVIVSDVTPRIQQPSVYQLEDESVVECGREERRKEEESLVVD